MAEENYQTRQLHMIMKILVSLVFLSMTSYAIACSCAARTEGEKISQADFYVRVNVIDDGAVIGNTRQYKIELMETYKSNDTVNPFLRMLFMYTTVSQFIYTNADSSTCGVTLVNGHSYNLAGTYKRVVNSHMAWASGRMLSMERRMYIGLCDDLTRPPPDTTLPKVPTRRLPISRILANLPSF